MGPKVERVLKLANLFESKIKKIAQKKIDVEQAAGDLEDLINNKFSSLRNEVLNKFITFPGVDDALASIQMDLVLSAGKLSWSARVLNPAGGDEEKDKNLQIINNALNTILKDLIIKKLDPAIKANKIADGDYKYFLKYPVK